VVDEHRRSPSGVLYGDLPFPWCPMAAAFGLGPTFESSRNPNGTKRRMVMKKLVITCMVLFVIAAVTTPAQALPLCFKWVQFCDGIQVNNQGLGGAEWYH
jgi:hypothetical protein